MDCISDDLYIYIIHTYWNAMHFKLNLQITTLHEHIKFHIFELWRMLEGTALQAHFFKKSPFGDF